MDVRRRPVEGAALQVSAQDEDRLVVTNTAGWVHIDGAGPSLHITVGQGHAGERGSTRRQVARTLRPASSSCPGSGPGMSMSWQPRTIAVRLRRMNPAAGGWRRVASSSCAWNARVVTTSPCWSRELPPSSPTGHRHLWSRFPHPGQ